MTTDELIASARDWTRDKSSGWLINELADEIERLRKPTDNDTNRPLERKMDDTERQVLKNILMNLEGYQNLPRREQLEHKVMMTVTLITALLREDAEPAT
jgi:hypothetical protein